MLGKGAGKTTIMWKMLSGFAVKAFTVSNEVKFYNLQVTIRTTPKQTCKGEKACTFRSFFFFPYGSTFIHRFQVYAGRALTHILKKTKQHKTKQKSNAYKQTHTHIRTHIQTFKTCRGPVIVQRLSKFEKIFLFVRPKEV